MHLRYKKLYCCVVDLSKFLVGRFQTLRHLRQVQIRIQQMLEIALFYRRIHSKCFSGMLIDIFLCDVISIQIFLEDHNALNAELNIVNLYTLQNKQVSVFFLQSKTKPLFLRLFRLLLKRERRKLILSSWIPN